MKTEKNILIAFLLNLFFSIFEFVGGVITGSVAIVSDAVHDIGDAASIGISYFLEKKSKRQPDEKYTYGYRRYSVIGGVITTLIILFGSITVICNAVSKIMSPTDIDYNGMILLSVIGASVNLCAAYFTREGESINQKAVNLHMLEDVLGWIVVLVGAIVMRFTNILIIDPLMSIGVALFIFINALKNLNEALELFFEKVPRGMSVSDIKEHVLEIEGVVDVHHIHIWSMDGHGGYATMHIVTSGEGSIIKEKVRQELKEHGIFHATLELEAVGECCHIENCRVVFDGKDECHHHHHHHH